MKRVRISPEYGCYPLWAISAGKQIMETVPPDSLPITAELALRISIWDKKFQETFDTDYPPDSKFGSEILFRLFQEEGEQIVESLKQQLGSFYEIEYLPASEALSGLIKKTR